MRSDLYLLLLAMLYILFIQMDAFADTTVITCVTNSGKTIELAIGSLSKSVNHATKDDKITSVVHIKDCKNFNEADDYLIETDGKYTITHSLKCEKTKRYPAYKGY